MTLTERIQGDLVGALKSKNTVAVATLRLLVAALKNELIARKQVPLEEADVVKVIQREIKKRKDAIEMYTSAGTPEKAAQEQSEIDVIQIYLPEAATDAEIDAIITKTIAEVGASGPADFGKVMKPVMAALAGRADGKTVQQKIKDLLATP